MNTLLKNNFKFTQLKILISSFAVNKMYILWIKIPKNGLRKI